MTPARIEILYFEGCPHHRPVLEMARAVTHELRLEAEIDEVVVRHDSDAQRLRFLGSPSVRVNGVDIESDSGERSQYALSCRMYDASGVPSRELLVKALSGARYDPGGAATSMLGASS